MTSNLPPGVTGNEWQIAGPQVERDEPRECTAEGVTLTVMSRYGVEAVKSAEENLRGYKGEPHTVDAVAMWLRGALRETQSVETDCPFSGDVTVVGSDGILAWTCPVCGTEYEEDHTDDY